MREIEITNVPLSPEVVDLLTGGQPVTPSRQNIVITPKPDQRKPCPECQQPAEQIAYLGVTPLSPGRIEPSERGGAHAVTAMFSKPDAVELQPCGHRFDGRTGELVGG